MTLRLFQRLVVLCGLAIMAAGPVAHAQTPPNGDDFSDAVVLPLNSAKTIKGVQFATEEAVIDDNSTCDADNSSNASVWFKFTLPDEGGAIDLDSAGSWQQGAFSPHMTLALTLYHKTVGLDEVACANTAGARLTEVFLSLGGTYYVRIGNEDGTLVNPTRYRLSIRARRVKQFLLDPLFDNGALGADWKVRKAGNPPQIFRDCSFECRVRFNGVAKGTLQQTVSFLPSALKFKVGDLLRAFVFVNSTPVIGSNIKITMRIAYSDGTPATTASLTKLVVHTSTTGSSAGFTVFTEIKSKAVKTVRFTVSSPTADDTFAAVSTQLALYAGTSSRADGPLPMPLAP